jgi:hypothetical protein
MSSTFDVPEITGVLAKPTDQAFEVTWESSGRPPQFGKGSFLLSLFVQAHDQSLRQFGVKFIDDEDPTVFVFDHGSSKQKTSIPAESVVGVNARKIVVSFPLEWVHGLSGSAECYGMVNLDGSDLDQRFELTVDFL